MPDKDFLFLHIKDLPFFRALVRAVEASYYQDLDLQSPILDLGCGDGHFASLALNQKVDVGLDPWFKPIHEAGKRDCYRLLVQADACENPFPDASFGSAFSNSVLEHISAIDDVLLETARVLKPGALFAFCVPNQGYFAELSLSRLFGKRYENWFKKISRVEHAESPDVWIDRLVRSGLKLERYWNYFPPPSMRMLEWGHFFGLPSWIIHVLTGKWILVPHRWNLIITEKILRSFSRNDEVENGTFTFYLARKPADESEMVKHAI